IYSPTMSGPPEETAGELLAARNLRSKAFIATKVWTQGKQAGIAQMENSFRLLRTDRIDLMQINYALDERDAEKRILPLARDRGVAVLCNRPFGGGGLLSRLKNKPLP